MEYLFAIYLVIGVAIFVVFIFSSDPNNVNDIADMIYRSYFLQVIFLLFVLITIFLWPIMLFVLMPLRVHNRKKR